MQEVYTELACMQNNLHLLTLLLPSLFDQLGDTKTITPFALKRHGSGNSPAMGLIVNNKLIYHVEEFIVPVLINQNVNESCIFLNENHAQVSYKKI